MVEDGEKDVEDEKEDGDKEFKYRRGTMRRVVCMNF